jgi:hypothetical protein
MDEGECRCEAASGLVDAATRCAFGPTGAYEQGYVDRGPRTTLFSQ